MYDNNDSDNISSDKKKLRNKLINDLINFINNSRDGELIFLIDLYKIYY